MRRAKKTLLVGEAQWSLTLSIKDAQAMRGPLLRAGYKQNSHFELGDCCQRTAGMLPRRILASDHLNVSALLAQLGNQGIEQMEGLDL